MRYKMNSWTEGITLFQRNSLLFRMITVLLVTSSCNIFMVKSTEIMVGVETGIYKDNTASTLFTRRTRFARSTSLESLHKPVIQNCQGESDEVSVNENESINTWVYQLKATNPSLVEDSGLVTFTIVSRDEAKNKFVIYPETGVIRTKEVFDRDEPLRVDSYFFTVRVTNHARPQLYSDCTLYILILDQNDHSPRFAKTNYNESVKWFPEMKNPLMRVSATDIDDYYNFGVVKYKLERGEESDNFFDYFQISVNTGEIRLKKNIPYSRIRDLIPFQFRVVAFDGGNPSKSATTNVTIYLQDKSGIYPPVFHPYRHRTKLPEIGWNKSVPVEIISVQSSANTLEQTDLMFFEIVNGHTGETNKGGTFKLEYVGNNTAHLKLDKELDCKRDWLYTITIRVTNKEHFATEAVIIIEVEDSNNEVPEFYEIRSGIVLENEPIGTFVMQVHAVDKDRSAPNRHVTYTLNEKDRENFEIDQRTGQITTKQQFDHEAQAMYLVTVTAQDGAPSAIRTDGKPNSQSIVVQIEIADINENGLCTSFVCIDGACITNEVTCEEDHCLNNFDDLHCVEDTEEEQVPLLQLQDSNVTVNPLQTVQLSCNVPHNQTSKIIWTWENALVEEWRDKFNYSFNYSFSEDNTNVLVRFVSDNVEGTFKCTVYHLLNNASASIKIKVPTFQKPYFEVTNMENSTKSWKQNEKLQLICVVGGIPKPRITWDWQHELPMNDSTSVSIAFSLKHNNYSLFITDVSTPKKVRFICKGENQEGQVAEYVDVIVGGLDVYEILIISGVALGGLLTFFLSLALIVYKYKQQKADNFLGGMSLKEFYEGNVERINPEIGVSDQANLLPFSQEKWEIPRDRIELGKTLGTGAFGLVLKAEAFEVMEGKNSTTVAVKTVQPIADESHYKTLIMELKKMAHLGQHLNVVNLIGAVTKNLSTKKELFVVMEFCKYGSVLSYMHGNRDSFINQLDPRTDQIDCSVSLRAGQNNKRLKNKCPGTETNPIYEVVDDDPKLPDYIGDYEKSEIQPFQSTDLLSWAFQAAKGMEYLASRKVLHGDLAARNVLLAENHIVKICDFGFAREKNYDYQKNINGLLLPIKWMAIESISCGIFSPKSDCWSFGILLWELFTLGDKPYPGMEINAEFVQGLQDGIRMDKPPYAPTTVYQIMLDCWAQDPQCRPQFIQVAERLKELVSTSVYTRLEDLNEQYTRLNQEEGMTAENDYFLKMGEAK